jgi:hypothetical protein
LGGFEESVSVARILRSRCSDLEWEFVERWCSGSSLSEDFFGGWVKPFVPRPLLLSSSSSGRCPDGADVDDLALPVKFVRIKAESPAGGGSKLANLVSDL